MVSRMGSMKVSLAREAVCTRSVEYLDQWCRMSINGDVANRPSGPKDLRTEVHDLQGVG